MLYERILVATDGSRTAARAVERAVGVAVSVGGGLTVLTAGSAQNAEKIVADEAERHRGSGVVITTVVRGGNPASVLVDEADGARTCSSSATRGCPAPGGSSWARCPTRSAITSRAPC